MSQDNTFEDPCYVVPCDDPSTPGHFADFKPNEKRRVPVVDPNDPMRSRVWANATLDAAGLWLEIVVTREDGKTQSHTWNYGSLRDKLDLSKKS